MNLVSLVVDGEAELMAWSGRFHEAAVHRRPVVLWLEVDPLIALRRAERERGGVWLARHIREFGGGVGGGSVLGALAVARGEGAADQRRVLESGGWSLVDIDASGDVASVLVEAMDGLASV